MKWFDFIIIKSTNRVEKIFIFILLYTVFSGAIRKWAPIGGLSSILLLIQLIIPFLFLMVDTVKSYLKEPILFIYFLFLVGFALNPLNKTIYHGVLGLILHLGFWYALFFVTENIKFIRLERFVFIIIFISCSEFVLGFIQYNLPVGHFLNRYASDSNSIAIVGDAARITGTFSYIGGLSAFIIFYLFFLVAVSKRRINSALYLVLLLMGFLITLMNGGRAYVFLYIFVVMLVWMRLVSNLKLKQVLPFATLGIGIVFIFEPLEIVLSNSTNTIIENFSSRVVHGVDSGEQSRRINEPLNEVLNFRGSFPLFGIGLGSTYQGANAIFGESVYAMDYGGYEEEAERTILEGGFALYFFKILLWIRFLRVTKIEKFIIVPIVILFVLYIPYTFNIYNSIFLFLGISMLERYSIK